jgi:hypothetical protein
MSLLRRPRIPASVAQPQTPSYVANEKIAVLESEIRELRPHRPPSLPPAAQGAVSQAQAERAVFLQAEVARQQLAVGRLDDARRTVADALLALDEFKNELSFARAAVLLAESLLTLDAPQHAKPRLQRAVKILDASTADGRWAVRGRIALGRTLVALDDVVGLDVLNQARQDCVMLGEVAIVAQIDHELREAEKTFDTPRHVSTGYGRPVSVMPPEPNR